MWTYKAKVNRVIDGDTLDLEVDLGFRVGIGVRIRLAGVDAPELSEPRGHMAKQFVEHLLPVGSPVTIRSEKDKRSFDRYVASVTLADGSDLAQRLRDEQLTDES